MCEATAYIVQEDKEVKILENVDLVDIAEEEVKLVSIFGEQKTLQARLKTYNSSEGKIVFEAM
ncbi:MAG: CooT family nickel-binding protein [Deltaproteobacteria bacterium]|nr:CooT family nickel-binding protein [Deltaproteobacteria bacterium]